MVRVEGFLDGKLLLEEQTQKDIQNEVTVYQEEVTNEGQKDSIEKELEINLADSHELHMVSLPLKAGGGHMGESSKEALLASSHSPAHIEVRSVSLL